MGYEGPSIICAVRSYQRHRYHRRTQGQPRLQSLPYSLHSALLGIPFHLSGLTNQATGMTTLLLKMWCLGECRMPLSLTRLGCVALESVWSLDTGSALLTCHSLSLLTCHSLSLLLVTLCRLGYILEPCRGPLIILPRLAPSNSALLAASPDPINHLPQESTAAYIATTDHQGGFLPTSPPQCHRSVSTQAEPTNPRRGRT